ncbi:hypothetical protein PUN28_016500 [Cardiocondyla obscurior]|uniref:Uncharacterized protein n=1 Tax=Cardiocondyla obscurior TaxID=286306 RepID=A0AAW2ER96_9HYME
MGCKSAAKSKLKKETVAPSSSSSLSFTRYNRTIQSSARETIQEQQVEYGSKSSLEDEEESEESNTAARVALENLFSLKDNSVTFGFADDNITR